MLPCSESQNLFPISFCSLSLLISALGHTKNHGVTTATYGSSDELFCHAPHLPDSPQSILPQIRLRRRVANSYCFTNPKITAFAQEVETSYPSSTSDRVRI